MIPWFKSRLARERHRERMPDVDPADLEIIGRVKRFTMTNPERLCALIQAVQHIVRARVPGDIVECGVWKGGSMMAVAHTLLQTAATERTLWLFDTFEGMPAPVGEDVTRKGEVARELFRTKRDAHGTGSDWCRSSLDEVRTNVESTRYPRQRLRFVKGKVEETIPGEIPEQISLLRLDTDFYESTKHELVHLFPRLSRGGVLIIDDYGYWQGCRKAVDEYFGARAEGSVLLNRIDSSARIGVKVC